MPLFALEHSTLLTEAEKAEVRGEAIQIYWGYLALSAVATRVALAYMKRYGVQAAKDANDAYEVFDASFEGGKLIGEYLFEY